MLSIVKLVMLCGKIIAFLQSLTVVLHEVMKCALIFFPPHPVNSISVYDRKHVEEPTR